jgi:hypothetical protein
LRRHGSRVDLNEIGVIDWPIQRDCQIYRSVTDTLDLLIDSPHPVASSGRGVDFKGTIHEFDNEANSLDYLIDYAGNNSPTCRCPNEKT